MAQNSGFCSPMSADRSADYQLSEILIPGRSYVYQILALTELSTMAVRINRKRIMFYGFWPKNAVNLKNRKLPVIWSISWFDNFSLSQFESVNDEASNELHKVIIWLIFHLADYMADNQLIDQLISENEILNLELHIFCPDYAPKIRSGLSITVIEKKYKLILL